MNNQKNQKMKKTVSTKLELMFPRTEAEKGQSLLPEAKGIKKVRSVNTSRP